MWFWLKIYLSKQCGAWRALSELPDKGWKLGSIDSLLKRIRKMGTVIVRKQGSGRPCSSHNSGGPCAQSRGQAKKAPICSRYFAWNSHFPFKYAHDNSPWSPSHMLQMMSCSPVVWSQSYHPSHSLINNLIVCNKSCYFSVINCKLNNK